MNWKSHTRRVTDYLKRYEIVIYISFHFFVEIEKFKFISPFEIQKFKFRFFPEDYYLEAQGLVTNFNIWGIVDIQLLFFNVFASMEPTELSDTKLQIKFVICRLFNLLSVAFALDVDLFGGLYLKFQLYIGGYGWYLNFFTPMCWKE